MTAVINRKGRLPFRVETGPNDPETGLPKCPGKQTFSVLVGMSQTWGLPSHSRSLNFPEARFSMRWTVQAIIDRDKAGCIRRRAFQRIHRADRSGEARRRVDDLVGRRRLQQFPLR